MRRFGLILLGIVIACLQLSLHGLSMVAVVPNLALVSLVIAANNYSFNELIWFALPLGLMLELGSGAPFGTQLMILLLFVMATKMLLRSTQDQTRTGYLLALTITATLTINLIIGLTLPTSILVLGWRFWLMRTILEALYNSLILGAWIMITLNRRHKPTGYKLPSH